MKHFVLLFLFLVWGAPAVADDMPAVGKSVAGEPVDVELVLAVDISFSVDEEEAKRQREGYVQALTSDEVLSTILSGPHGRIAVAYVEWADAHTQIVRVDWSEIASRADAQKFAQKVREAPFQQGRYTAIGSALSKSVQMIADNDYAGLRKVIDISGDGPQNQGISLAVARAEASAHNIVVNGLAIKPKHADRWRPQKTDVAQYFRDFVIVGPSAFVIPVETPDHFKEAILRKMLLEIAAAPAYAQANTRPAP